MAEQISTSLQSTTLPGALQLSEQAIATVKHNIHLCEQLVKEVLERDIDFGTIPGVPQPFLWDSGAAKIMSAFNCYADYKVIDSLVQVPHIRYTITCQLINRQSHHIVATGIGAASTKEIKHRYRWVDNPEENGISRKGLKQRKDGKFRIPNPDTEDLLNTIAKMAAKRSDVDAAQSLPGVASTLRKLFLSPATRKPTSPPAPSPAAKPSSPSPDQDLESKMWNWFWAKLKTLNVSSKEAHQILAVNSIKQDWVGVQERTLQEAYEVIKDAIMQSNSHKEVNKPWEKQQLTSDTKPPAEPLFPE